MNNTLFLQYASDVQVMTKQLAENGWRDYKVGEHSPVLARGTQYRSEPEDRYEAEVTVRWHGVVDGQHSVTVRAASSFWPSQKAWDHYQSICRLVEQWKNNPLIMELPPSGPWENT